MQKPQTCLLFGHLMVLLCCPCYDVLMKITWSNCVSIVTWMSYGPIGSAGMWVHFQSVMSIYSWTLLLLIALNTSICRCTDTVQFVAVVCTELAFILPMYVCRCRSMGIINSHHCPWLCRMIKLTVSTVLPSSCRPCPGCGPIWWKSEGHHQKLVPRKASPGLCR